MLLAELVLRVLLVALEIVKLAMEGMTKDQRLVAWDQHLAFVAWVQKVFGIAERAARVLARRRRR